MPLISGAQIALMTSVSEHSLSAASAKWKYLRQSESGDIFEDFCPRVVKKGQEILKRSLLPLPSFISDEVIQNS